MGIKPIMKALFKDTADLVLGANQAPQTPCTWSFSEIQELPTVDMNNSDNLANTNG